MSLYLNEDKKLAFQAFDSTRNIVMYDLVRGTHKFISQEDAEYVDYVDADPAQLDEIFCYKKYLDDSYQRDEVQS